MDQKKNKKIKLYDRFILWFCKKKIDHLLNSISGQSYDFGYQQGFIQGAKVSLKGKNPKYIKKIERLIQSGKYKDTFKK